MKPILFPSPQGLPCLDIPPLRPTAGICVTIWPFSSTRRQIKETHLVKVVSALGVKGCKPCLRLWEEEREGISAGRVGQEPSSCPCSRQEGPVLERARIGADSARQAGGSRQAGRQEGWQM